MLHWACDRGHLDVVKFLINRGADVNVQDGDLQTPLHYGKINSTLLYILSKLCCKGSPLPFSLLPPSPSATSCDQSEIVSYLLTLPALNRTLKDCDGCLAVEVTSDPSIRKMFEDMKVEN